MIFFFIVISLFLSLLKYFGVVKRIGGSEFLFVIFVFCKEEFLEIGLIDAVLISWFFRFLIGELIRDIVGYRIIVIDFFSNNAGS